MSFIIRSCVLVLIFEVHISQGGYPVIQFKSNQDQTHQYMARFTAVVLRHKYCLLYTRTAWQYGCYCGIVPNDCSIDAKPKDCLDSCCHYHSQCFKNLPRNCTGLEAFTWKWRVDLDQMECSECRDLLWNRYKHGIIRNEEQHLQMECHCKTCLCDKKFAECFAEYPCPKMFRFLNKDECDIGKFNISEFLNVHAL